MPLKMYSTHNFSYWRKLQRFRALSKPASFRYVTWFSINAAFMCSAWMLPSGKTRKSTCPFITNKKNSTLCCLRWFFFIMMYIFTALDATRIYSVTIFFRVCLSNSIKSCFSMLYLYVRLLCLIESCHDERPHSSLLEFTLRQWNGIFRLKLDFV